jgi:allantoin racemase
VLHRVTPAASATDAEPRRVLVVCPWSPGRERTVAKFAEGQLANVRLGPGISFEFRMAKLSPDVWDNYHDLMLADVGALEAGLDAQREGYDAVVVETIGDSGVEQLRAVLDIPVVGAGQASHLAAMMLGRRFSVIVVWEGFRLIHERTLRNYGWEDRCASIRCLDMKPGEPDFADMFGGREERFYPALAELAELCVAEDGADTIVLGSTTMYAAYPYLRDRLPVPVVEPAAASYKAAESLLALGLTQSRAAYAPATSPLADVLHPMFETGRRWPPPAG